VNYAVVESQTFWDCVAALRRDDAYKGALMDTLVELRRQPFKNPVLQTHDVGKAKNGKKVYSSDVGGRAADRRLIWQVFNKTIVVLLYGTHAVQDRAKRMSIAFDPDEHVVTVIEEAPDTGVDRDYRVQRARVGRLFMAWTDGELAGSGFAPHVIVVLRRLDNDDQLFELEEALGQELFERAFNLLTTSSPVGAAFVEVASVVEAEEPLATDEDIELERQLADEKSGGWFTRTEPEVLREVLGQPIEDWMVFLHPDQRNVISRRFEGPSRIRGAAGTGKTVVGLHRAAWLAEQNRENSTAKPVLFTTYIKSLPPVFESLFLRLPQTRSGEVEFVHVDRLARQVCTSAGDKVNTDPKKIEAAFATAFKRTVFVGTPLGDSGFGRQYLRDEITAVVKGRGIVDLDEYLEIARTGRRAPMGRQQRTQVWDLMLEWDSEMAKRGTLDFADVLLRARDHARQLSTSMFSSVIVDEAQDLTLVGLQLLRALVNAPDAADRPNGLMLLGDGAQRIYAGGFKLRQAGVEVRGRTTLLSTNYRNTDEIIGIAQAVAGDEEIDDLGEEYRRRDEEALAQRRGARPLLIEAKDFDHQMEEVGRRIQELSALDRIGSGDIAVLLPTNSLVGNAIKQLTAAGLDAQKLDDYDGRPSNKVKVGTFHRAKGLEFKVVFLPAMSAGAFPRPPQEGHSDDEAAEARGLSISQLFVAMTRARDLLVLLYDGDPSEVLQSCTERFERVSA
jgi:hypothetical protein